MPSFDLVVVGCGGGPDETNLSAYVVSLTLCSVGLMRTASYLIKPFHAKWADGIIALEAGVWHCVFMSLLYSLFLAGSGRGALTQILKQNPDLFNSRSPDYISTATYSSSDIYSFIR